MLKSTKWLLLFLSGLVFCIVAYNSQEVTLLTPSPLPAITATQTSTLTPIPSPTKTKSLAVTVPTFTPSPSKTPIVTPSPTHTFSPIPPTPTPFILSDPTPNDLDVIRFVFNRRQPDTGAQTEYFFKDLATGEYSDFTRQDADINGDGQPEILISGSVGQLSAYTAILAYSDDDAWQEIFYIEEVGRYCADVQSKVESSHVEVDFLTCGGGTGFFGLIWTQHWIQCNRDNCADVWSAPLLKTSITAHNTISRNYSISTIEQPDNQTVQLTVRRFEIAGIPLTVGDFPVETPRRIVGPDIQQTYQWNGSIYQLESEKQIALGLEITGEFDAGTNETFDSVNDLLRQPFKRSDDTYDYNKILSARAEFLGISDIDNQGDIIWQSEHYWPDVASRDGKTGQKIASFVSAKNRPLCRLTIQRQILDGFELIGRVDVPCTAKFTRLFWVDINGDDDEELFMLTILPDSDGLQRLYIYSTGKAFTELAIHDGAINGSDGVGIKWKNTGNDFRLLVGIPLLDRTNCNRSLSCLTLERLFETYRWDKESNSFQLEVSP
jgi:hypothetical protein